MSEKLKNQSDFKSTIIYKTERGDDLFGIAEKFSDFMENCLKQNRKMMLRRKGGAIFLKRH